MQTALVGEAHVHRVGVGGRMDCDRLDAHLVARAVDAQGNLAAVGDQEFFDGHGVAQPMVNSGWSNSTGWLFSTCTASSVPDAGATIGFMTFIASMIRIVSPAFTAEPTLAKLGAPGSGER